MKKTAIVLLLVLVMVITCGCGNAKDTSSEESTRIQTSEEIKVESSSADKTTNQASDSKPVESSKPVHTHKYSDATCTEPQKCSCGATKGAASGEHSWEFANGTCTVCKAKYPDFKPIEDVTWEYKYQGESLTVHTLTLSSDNYFGEPYFYNQKYVEATEQEKNSLEISMRLKEIDGKLYLPEFACESTIKTQIKQDTLTITLNDVSGKPSITFKRTDNETLKIISISGKVCCNQIKVGTEFKMINY